MKMNIKKFGNIKVSYYTRVATMEFMFGSNNSSDDDSNLAYSIL